jgi:hypothetical protein
MHRPPYASGAARTQPHNRALQQVNGFPGSRLWQWLFHNSTEIICKAHSHNISIVIGDVLSSPSTTLPQRLPSNSTGTSSPILSRGLLPRALQLQTLHLSRCPETLTSQFTAVFCRSVNPVSRTSELREHDLQRPICLRSGWHQLHAAIHRPADARRQVTAIQLDQL